MSIIATIQVFLYTLINLLIHHLQAISDYLTPPASAPTPQSLRTRNNLLTLPTEIRSLIYNQLVHSNSIVEISCIPIDDLKPAHQHHRPRRYTLTLPWLGILGANKTLNAELTHHLTKPALLGRGTRTLRIGGPHLWPVMHVLLASALAQKWAKSLVFSERHFWNRNPVYDFKRAMLRREYLGAVRKLVVRDGGVLREAVGQRRGGAWERCWRVWLEEEIPVVQATGTGEAGSVQVVHVEVQLDGVDYERVERRRCWSRRVLAAEGGEGDGEGFENDDGETVSSVVALQCTARAGGDWLGD